MRPGKRALGMPDVWERLSRGISPAGRFLRLPSPLDMNERLSAHLGVTLWVKREDLLDDCGCGHKSRKMAYAAADAQAAGASILVTAASLPSSQAAAVSMFARRLGMRAHIVYCGDDQQPPDVASGYYALVKLLGASVTWKAHAPWVEWAAYVDTVVQEERAAGERPYVIPPGISRWPGFLGSIELGVEVGAQIDTMEAPVWFVGAAGSGATLWGLGIGLQIAGVTGHVHGTCIGPPADDVRRSLRAIRDAISVHIPSHLLDGEVHLHDEARGGGYGRAGAAECDAMTRAAREFGLWLDPTYTAKAFLGLEALVRAGRIPRGAQVVFLQSAGSMGSVAARPDLDRWLA